MRQSGGNAALNQNDLESRVAELVQLLRHCGRDEKADWLSRRYQELDGEDPKSARRALRRGLAGGMGSILDAELVPPPGSALTPAEANKKLWRLVDAVGEGLEP